MRPLESHVQITSHLMMYNRVKDLLTREGFLSADPSDDDVRQAFDRWTRMIERVQRHDEVSAR